MAQQNAYQAYQNNTVNTASSGDLTLMLYNGCIKFIKMAIKFMDAEDYEQKNVHIQKAQNIIQELMLTLNQDIEISKQMLPLYEYMHHRLTAANINNDQAVLEEVLGLVTEFRDTWKQVIVETRQQQYVQGAQV